MKEPRIAPSGPQASDIMSELRVTAHLMRLDPGLFCIVQMPTPVADPISGLPGVRLSLPPGPGGRPEAVTLAGFHDNGWLSGTGDAALVRVSGGPAQILVTIYQSPEAKDGTAPNLQVRRVFDVVPPNGTAAPVPAQAAAIPKAAHASVAPGPVPNGRVMEMVAHIQERGDVGAMLGEWLGERNSRRWIEGFGIAPGNGLAPADLEYQAVLGPGWLSPWVEGGQFCGSRGMALPVLGLRVRLRGKAASTYRLNYTATFVDGTEIGPVADGEACEAPSLAALESFRVAVEHRPTAAPSAAPSATRSAAPTKAARAVAALGSARPAEPRPAVAAKAPAAPALAAKVAPVSKAGPKPAGKAAAPVALAKKVSR